MAMTLRQLLERRAKITRELRELADAADDDTGLTSAQQEAFDKLKAALADLEAAISNRAAVDDAERRIAGAPVAGGGGDRHLDREIRRFSIVRAIAGAAGIPGVDDALEREVMQETARRAGRSFQGMAVPRAALHRPLETRVVTTTTPVGIPGGNLIATLLDGSQYIDALRAALRIRQLGATVIADLTSNVDIPRLAQTASAGWVAENTALTPSDEGFDKVSLRPHHAGAMVELSRNMLQQSTPDIEQVVRADLAAVLARTLDGAAIAGTGTSAQPTGILNVTGIGTHALGTNGGSPIWGDVVALIEAVENYNVGDDARGFLGNAKFKAYAMATPKLPATTPAMGFIMDAPDTLAGYPFKMTNLVPSNGTKGTGTGLSTLIYGNWSDLLLGFWSELDMLVNPYDTNAYPKGNVLVRAMLTCDVAVRHPQSFAAITDIIAP